MPRITKPSKLLDNEGNLLTAGWATEMLFEYNRNEIKANGWRIKEWDYYYVGNNDHAICLTAADMGYVGALSASFLDFTAPREITKSSVILFRKYPGFGPNGEELSYDFYLGEMPEENMSIATPFDKPKHFYYNAKMNCMSARGSFKLGDTVYRLDDALGTLDWGRGVWTFDNTWYWASLQTVLADGRKFGFNLGYGFGDTSAATENMLFLDGKAIKLEDVRFNIPGDGTKDVRYTEPWTFTSSDGRLELDFEPLIDRYAPIDLKVFCMIPHQVFGYFSGDCITDTGETIRLERVLGFAEKVHNKW